MDLRKTTLSPKPGLLHTQVQDETVILDPHSGTYFGLEGAAVPIWKRLEDGPASFADLLHAVMTTFEDVPKQQAEADLEAFLKQLVADGLLVAA